MQPRTVQLNPSVAEGAALYGERVKTLDLIPEHSQEKVKNKISS